MTAYQKNDALETPGMAKLRQFIQTRLNGQSSDDFQAFERELHTRMMECEREFLKQKLESYDVQVDEVQIDGKLYRNVLFSSETYISAAGDISVERHLFRPVGGGRCVCPLELRAGVIGGLWTPLAARQAMYAMAHLHSYECETLFDEIGNMAPSHSSLDRLPKVLSPRWEEHRAVWEEAVRGQDTVPIEAVVVAVSLDGVMVPMRATEFDPKEATADDIGQQKNKNSEGVDVERPLAVCGPDDPAAENAQGQEPLDQQAEVVDKTAEKAPPRPAVYKEAACGTVTLYDSEGDRLSTVYFGRMPEHKKRTLTEMLKAEYDSIISAAPTIRPVYIADGAEENWRFLRTLTGGVDGVEIVDAFHAFDHLKKALDAYHGDKTPEAKAQFERYRTLLKEADDGPEQVIRALKYRYRRSSGKAKEIIKLEELTYFRNQRHRMRYAQYLRDKLPIGSGVVEAANKTLISVRFKRSGQSWTLSGGQGVLTFRSMIKSGRWEGCWNVVAASYKAEVIPLATRRRRPPSSVQQVDKAA